MKFSDRLNHAWNAFKSEPNKQLTSSQFTSGSYGPNYKVRFHRYSQSSFANTVFNRIALDAASVSIQHVKIDAKTMDRSDVNSGLNNCLQIEANIDQSNSQFIQDIVMSMFDEGSIAVVPVDTTEDPTVLGSFEIKTMRVGKIVQWYPQSVKVELYNDINGTKQEVLLPKKAVAIIENPLYAVINGENATLTRLLNKISLLDGADDIMSSGRLDLILQMPRLVSSKNQTDGAKQRVSDIEDQLSNNKHGIAYIDPGEHITQLNRPVNPQLLEDIANLTDQFYNQTGLTKTVFDGTATEPEMRNYFTRTIDPIISSIKSEFIRKFITKTARSQGQTLESYRNPFELVPISDLADIADKVRRNSILTGNEVRQILGYKPNDAPEADLLYNPNMTASDQVNATPTGSVSSPEAE